MKPRDCGQLTLFPEASLDFASRSHVPEKGAESWTAAIYGPKCSVLSPNLRRVGLLLKMYLESCELPLPTLSRTWKVQDITPSCLCMKLRLSARSTAAQESRLLPTVTTQESEHPDAELTESGRRKSKSGKSSHSMNLADTVRLWATPNTMDYLPQRSPEALIRQATTTRKGRTRPANLREQVCPETAALWPTPTSRDYKDGSAKECQNVPVNGLLGRAVHQNRLLTTPTASDAVGTHGGGNSRSLRTDAGGQLNPAWVEWLMGYPAGWTELKPSEMP